MSLKVLYAASEALPFSKTGGLADVAHALPEALAQSGANVRLVTPAYRGALDRLREPLLRATLTVCGQRFAVWEGHPAHERLRVWLIDCPSLYARDGTPYVDASGRDHADNAWRFGCFCEAVARLAMGEACDWRADVLHLNDWQTGLAPLWLPRGDPSREAPRTLFTIHNLAYQGVFDRREFDALGVGADLWHPDGIEFHGMGSFLKAGLTQCEWLTTVSPSYAREIQTPAFGHGLDGLLRHRRDRLCGILNGIHEEHWDPQCDPYLPFRYGFATVKDGKRRNRLVLRTELGLPDDERPLVGIVSRFAEQKGIDLLLAAAAEIRRLPLQFAILGAGDAALERRFEDWARSEPQQLAVRIGYDEGLAHRIEAGADMFLMPSRYEPCGLNQMYSQRYGTVPIVRRVGGLADSVIDATPDALAAHRATGIVFEHADTGGVLYGLRRALELFGTPHWISMQDAGMRQDFSWRHTAAQYLEIYKAVRR
ncbi:glycogen synthase GlgA [Fontimonas sp. SYSU GA230001]|uniref:glycogen synthase GlgA n=1 Tax=Fontimonas sp. SYSU GA230001 TaxID=3142450 RepID=UPI0032B4E39D